MNTTPEIDWFPIIFRLTNSLMDWEELEEAEQVELTQFMKDIKDEMLIRIKQNCLEKRIYEYNKAYFTKPSILL